MKIKYTLFFIAVLLLALSFHTFTAEASGAIIDQGITKQTLFDGQGIYGTSIQLGPDGFPRIAYVNYDAQTLNYIRCTDANCSTPVTTEVETDIAQNGQGSMLTLGSDGFARIAYADVSGNIQLVRCLNQDCSTKNTTAVTSANDINDGYYGVAILIGDDDLPRIEYAKAGSTDITHFVRCTDADCSSPVDTAVTSDTYDSYDQTGLAIGPDHFARILYEAGDDSLKLLRCTDADCSAPVIDTINPDLESLFPGYYGKAIGIGSDGFPRIAYVDGVSPYALHYVVCTNADCTSPIITQLSDTDGYSYISFGMGLRSGNLVSISHDDADGHIHMINCTDSTCSTFDDVLLDGSLAHGTYGGSSLIIDSDDLPRIAYSDYYTGLYFARLGSLDGMDVLDTDPATPSSLGPSNLVDGSSSTGAEPSLTFTQADSDVGDTTRYQIQIDDSTDFSSPLIDYTSALATPGASGFTIGQDAGSGSYAVGSLGQVLSPGNYYWQVRSSDSYFATSSYAVANSGAVAFVVTADTPSPTPPVHHSSHSSTVLSPSQVAQIFAPQSPLAPPTLTSPATIPFSPPVPFTPPAPFVSYLVVGLHSDSVFNLQKLLNSLGFTITISGPGSIGNETDFFGALTKAAVIKFQIAHGITPTGTVGPITRAALNGGK